MHSNISFCIIVVPHSISSSYINGFFPFYSNNWILLTWDDSLDIKWKLIVIALQLKSGDLNHKSRSLPFPAQIRFIYKWIMYPIYQKSDSFIPTHCFVHPPNKSVNDFLIKKKNCPSNKLIPTVYFNTKLKKKIWYFELQFYFSCLK